MSTPGGPPPEHDPATRQFPAQGAQHRGPAPGGGSHARAAGGGGRPGLRWLPLLGGVLGVLLVLGALLFLLGGGPAVGECIRAVGTDAFETVECDSAEAQYRVLGTDDDMTRAEFDADPDTCAAVEGTTVALWSGTDEAEDGSVYCAEPV